MEMNKKAYYLSLDALMALVIILGVVLFIKPHTPIIQNEMHVQEDIIRILSAIKIGEIENDYAKQLIAERKITNLNQTVLEQIGEFYALSMPEAQLLTESILTQLNTAENIGLYFNNQQIGEVSSIPESDARDLWASREIISGIQQGDSVKGFSSRAFLSAVNKVKYFYFGGYTGDGNITAKISYNGTIDGANIEAAFSKPFSLYINNQLISNFTPLDEYSPYSIDLSEHLAKFVSGENYIEFRGNELYISGGYIKINYKSAEFFSLSNEHILPGISGAINLYDSFYIPGVLNNLEIYLHYYSKYPLFMNIGNITVYQSNQTNEVITTITNIQLSPLLNYNQISQKTIPFRIGLLQNIQNQSNGNADIVLITDLSGSMNSKMDSDEIGTSRNCNDPDIYSDSTKKISVVKCINKEVIDKILNISGNRVALSSFYGDENSPFKGRVYEEGLSSNAAYLKSKIDSYTPQGGTCICCAINDAYKILNEQSNSNKSKFIIVMSDGIPTHRCQAASGCSGTRTGLQSDEGLWLGYGAGCYGGQDDCDTNDCLCASQNANWSACRAYNDLRAKIYSIGFGPIASCSMASTTLNNIAQCGNGQYYVSSNASLLKEFYDTISQEIIDLSYLEQVSIVMGNLEKTILYPDSYIKYDYQSPNIPYGLIINTETSNFNNLISQGAFNIPNDSEILEINAVSYSGSKWTDEVNIDNKNIFNLSNYGNNFLYLGDPYIINIPLINITKGEHIIKISTATKPSESLGGSNSDKIIYTLLKNVSGYSPIVSSAWGCNWKIQFQSGENKTLAIPFNYSGGNNCEYSSQQIAFNQNDAISNAVYNLLVKLDIDNNRKIDTKFSENDIQISSSEITGIPFTWETEVQTRVWR